MVDQECDDTPWAMTLCRSPNVHHDGRMRNTWDNEPGQFWAQYHIAVVFWASISDRSRQL
jgi:hypothetical protein